MTEFNIFTAEILNEYAIVNIGSFLSAAILLTLMPGPDILFVLTQSIARGRRAGIIFASGLCTGLLFHIAAVVLGVSVLIKGSPVAFGLLKMGGTGYLFFLGIKAFMMRKKAVLDLEVTSSEIGKLYRKGILMNILNPKVILFFLAFLPQFVNMDAGYPEVQISLLGILFMVQAFLIFALVALLAGKISKRLMGNPKIACRINVITALIYCTIALSILFV